MTKRAIVLLATIVGGFLAPIATTAQPPATDTQTSFRFELEEARSHRGRGVEGYVYNDLPWRITNVRVRVDSLDGNGTVTSSASGWVIGDVRAGGRAYFYVPVSSPAATYRASVLSFDKVLLETPRLESP
ncbi:MAG TPA: FxLYD domain-containing protein [Methylomirabilota bacterium]|jgi:hypothetical protein